MTMGKSMIITIGASATAIVAIVGVSNLIVIPFLNSDFSPVVGAQRFAQATQMQKQIGDTLDKTVKTLDNTVQSLAAIKVEQDRTACAEMNRSIRIAIEALEKDRNSATGRSLLDDANQRMRSMPGCLREPLP